jgi:DNA-dependent RNA polymerase auxiliary subunit epsilon
MKERETIQQKQHDIEKLQEEHVKYERSAKLFEASKSNL